MKQPVTMLVIMFAAGCAPCCVAAADLPLHLFGYDASAPPGLESTLIQDREGVQLFDLTYGSPRQGRVTAYLAAPHGEGPFAGIIFAHWGLGDRKEFLPDANLLARAGAVSLLVDHPFARPQPWTVTLQELVDPENEREVLIQAVVDLRRAIDVLQSMPEVDGSRIAIVGHSYGAQCAAILAAIDDRVKAAVLMGGAATKADVWAGVSIPRVRAWVESFSHEHMEKYLQIMGPLDGIRYVPHAAPTPLLFQFARFEQYFTTESMERYAEAASNPKVVIWYDTDHALNDVAAVADRARWLGRHLDLKPLEPILRNRVERKLE